MTATLVIGAHGRTGSLVVDALLASGHEVVGTVRQHEHLQGLTETGATGVLLDLMAASADDLRRVMEGIDAVVYAAGSGWASSREVVSEIDGRAIIRATDAAVSAGVTRFVVISAHRVDEDFGDSDVQHLLWAKRAADAHLRAAAIEWTIIRPDALTSGPATGRVAAATQVPNGAMSRADLADVVRAALDNGLAKKRQFEVTEGTVPIETALRRLDDRDQQPVRGIHDDPRGK